MTGKKRGHVLIISACGMVVLSIVIYFVVLQSKSVNQEQQYATNHETAKSKSKSHRTKTQTGFIDVIERNTKVHRFNRDLSPLLKHIVTTNYFKYFKVNLNRPCELWCNDGTCNRPDCDVQLVDNPDECSGLFSGQDYYKRAETSNELATVNTELNSENLVFKLYECDDNDDHDSQYVDLLKNPERFTGYDGESAHRIWRAIYKENCYIRRSSSDDLCYEKQIFYEAISGLHASINTHLCAEYPSNAARKHTNGTFEHNLTEFLKRFDKHPEYIENLYRLFQLEIIALVKCKPYLLERVSWPDQGTRDEINELLNLVDNFEIPNSLEMSLKPSHELATNFRNITTKIIDCVACAKCKLWGKVQLRGLGTAFNILSLNDMGKLYLNPQDIVALVNAIARLSHSIEQLEQFKQLVLNASDHESSNHDGDNLFNQKPSFSSIVNLNKP